MRMRALWQFGGAAGLALVLPGCPLSDSFFIDDPANTAGSSGSLGSGGSGTGATGATGATGGRSGNPPGGTGGQLMSGGVSGSSAQGGSAGDPFASAGEAGDPAAQGGMDGSAGATDLPNAGADTSGGSAGSSASGGSSGAGGSGGSAGSSGAGGSGGSSGVGGVTGDGGDGGVGGESDGGMSGGDGSAGAGRVDPCSLETELCNARDDNCDRQVDEAGACPSDCQAFLVAGRAYMYCSASQKVSPQMAQTRCAQAGLRIVSIETSTENANLKTKMTSVAPSVQFTIGATDTAVEGDWRWVDGALFWRGTGSGAPVGSGFANWQGSNPNGSTSQNCAVFEDGTWLDKSCSTGDETFPYLCEEP